MGTRIHSSEKISAASTLPPWYEDDYFDGADLGAAMFDLSRLISFGRQAAPSNGDIIRDILDASFEPPAAALETASVILQSGQALGFDGARFDFSSLAFAANVLSPNVVRMGNRVLSQIWGPGSGAAIASPSVTSGAVNNDAAVTAGGAGYSAADARIVVTGGGGTGAAFSPVFTAGVLTAVTRTAAGTGYTSAPTLTLVPAAQRFLAGFWCQLPTDADWNTTGSTVTMMTGHESNTGEDAANLARIQMVNSPTTSGPGLSARIPNLIGSALQININVPAASRGQKGLVGLYRTETATTLYLRTAAGGLTTASTNAGQPQRHDNIADFSAKYLDFGLCQPGTPNLGSAGQPSAKNFKIGKGFIEALRITGRDPLAVLEAEWAREVVRGVHA